MLSFCRTKRGAQAIKANAQRSRSALWSLVSSCRTECRTAQIDYSALHNFKGSTQAAVGQSLGSLDVVLLVAVTGHLASTFTTISIQLAGDWHPQCRLMLPCVGWYKLQACMQDGSTCASTKVGQG